MLEGIGFLLLFAAMLCPAMAVGVNWGTLSSHPLPPATVVKELLLPNNITKVKLFDADPAVLQSLSGTGISVAVGIPNNMLSVLSSKKAAASWVHDNVTRYFRNGGIDGGVRIEYIAVGDEPFLLSYGQKFQPFVVSAAANIQLALWSADLADKVRVVVPCSSDAYNSSAGFRQDVNGTMSQLLPLLTKHRSPFFLDLDPFPTLRHCRNPTINHFLDSSINALVSSLAKAGFGDMEIVIGKIGWPTDGSPNASASVAQSFMRGLKKKPMLEAYVFSLMDENLRSIASGDHERHFGVFTFDGQAKYSVDLGQGSNKELAGAKNVDYLSSRWCVANAGEDLSKVSPAVIEDACDGSDCTPLSAGGSCSAIGWPANLSYAFNSYYQQREQQPGSCDFGGLGFITTVDPSLGNCLFAIGLRASSAHAHASLITMLGLSVPLIMFFSSLIVS